MDCLPRCRRTAILAVYLWAALVLATPSRLAAGDWPQILGPARDGKAQNETLPNAWPAGGPPLVWKKEVGSGFAGVAVVGSRAVVFHRIAGQLVAEALDAASGKPLWKLTIPTRYASSISPDNGPRCVPVIHESQVYLMGPGGELACASLETGNQIWARNLMTD